MTDTTDAPKDKELPQPSDEVAKLTTDHKFDLPENKQGWIPANDPFLSKLLDDVGEKPTPPAAPEGEEGETKEVKPETKPEEKPKEEAKPKEEKQEAKPKEDKPAAKEEPAAKPIRFDAVLDGVGQTQPRAAQPQAKEKPAAPPADPDAEYIAALGEDERAEIETAAMVERHIPDRYKGHRKKLVDYYKRIDVLKDGLRQADPTRTFDANDEEWTKKIAAIEATRPRVSRSDEQKAYRADISSTVREDIKREMTPEVAELDRRNRAIEEKPLIDARVKTFNDTTRETLMASEKLKPFVEAMTGTDEDKKKEASLEIDIIQGRMAEANELAREYLMIQHGLSSIDPNAMTPTQATLRNFLITFGRQYETVGKDAIRNGKRFVGLDRWAQLTDEERKTHWTLSAPMIVGLIANRAQRLAEEEINAETERDKKYGRTRVKVTKPADSKSESQKKDKQSDDDENPPKSVVSPAGPSGVEEKGKFKAPITADDVFNPANAYDLPKT